MNTDLTCMACGETLPKYAMDRFSDDLCGAFCCGFLDGLVVGAALMLWGIAVSEMVARMWIRTELCGNGIHASDWSGYTCTECGSELDEERLTCEQPKADR